MWREYSPIHVRKPTFATYYTTNHSQRMGRTAPRGGHAPYALEKGNPLNHVLQNEGSKVFNAVLSGVERTVPSIRVRLHQPMR